MDEQTLLRFHKYLAKENGDYILKDDLKGIIKLVTTLLKEIKKYTDDTSNATQNRVYAALLSAEKEFDTLKNDIKENINVVSQHDESFKEIKNELENIRQLVPNTEGLSLIVNKIEDSIKVLESKIPEIPKELDGEAIRDRLEMLTDEDRLDKSAIKGLEEDIEELRSQITSKTTVSGVSNMRIQQAFKYILKTERPTGDIDGSNTEYTVTQPIFAVLGMSLNGETIAQLPNYTINGNKIIFASALPTEYAGMDFEIKYI